MIEDVVRFVLTTDARVSSLVGSRVYPLTMPQNGTLPAIVFQRISTVGSYTLEGPTTPTAARIQLSLMSASFTQVRALAAAVWRALDAYSGQVGRDIVNFIEVVNFLDDFESDTGICRVVMDIRVQSNEGALES